MSKVFSDVDIHDALASSYTNWVNKLIEYGEDRYESNFHTSDPMYWVLNAMGLSDGGHEGPESLSKNPTLKDEDDEVYKYVYDKFENELNIKRLREVATNLAKHPEVDIWEFASDHALVPLIHSVFGDELEDIEDFTLNLVLKIEEAQGE